LKKVCPETYETKDDTLKKRNVAGLLLFISIGEFKVLIYMDNPHWPEELH